MLGAALICFLASSCSRDDAISSTCAAVDSHRTAASSAFRMVISPLVNMVPLYLTVGR